MAAAGSNTGPLGIPPGGPYFVFPASGTIQRQSNPVLAEGLVAAGWVGFPDQTTAATYAHTGSLAHTADQAGGAISGAVTSTAGLISNLTNANTWLRVAEVALGLVLIAVGLARLTHAVPIATKIATTAGKAAIVA